MSKMDDLRAMREARYEQAVARAAQADAVPTRAKRQAPRPVEAKPAAADPKPPTSPVCGHRSMNGRSCTRELGHAAKSHRYA